MRFPFISVRRARDAITVATSGFRCIADEADKRYCEEHAARLKAEAHARDLEQRLYELTLANQLHDQQLHAKKEDA
ncbi:hypothetical protein [Streptomyces sp. NPDC058664]|uniref:hypothetical protein n=1 Tax=unclassified Streptomyces TaxID=2593676 RepID=UPI0036603386